jgi:hypothetical protein
LFAKFIKQSVLNDPVFEGAETAGITLALNIGKTQIIAGID